MITFQGDGFKSLRKTVLVCKTGKSLFKRFISQKGREKIYDYKFSKVNLIEKESQGLLSQGQACLKFQAEGTVKAVLISYIMVFSSN